jgi:3'-phosphoadenosine 5'-phosphosulfate sulfotransferase (PAPS reductase)/FAD synthetase
MNIINFSGGRTSAYMTKRLIDEGLTDYIVTFQNTGKEMPQTLDFINECDKRWGLNIVWLEYRKPSIKESRFEIVTYKTASRKGEPFDQLLEQRPNSGVPNHELRWCTNELKIQTVKRYLKSINLDDFTWINGIRYDEPTRFQVESKYHYDIWQPLVKWKITKQDILQWWKLQDFDLQLNQPYGNCDCCFQKGKGLLAQIAKENPHLFDWWINHEKERNKTFKKEISYERLVIEANLQIGIWDGDPSFECFCHED